MYVMLYVFRIEGVGMRVRLHLIECHGDGFACKLYLYLFSVLTFDHFYGCRLLLAIITLVHLYPQVRLYRDDLCGLAAYLTGFG